MVSPKFADKRSREAHPVANVAALLAARLALLQAIVVPALALELLAGAFFSSFMS